LFTIPLASGQCRPCGQRRPDSWSRSKSRRSSDQNAKFHAICADLERSGLPWAGKPRDAAAWKVLLVSGHSIATGQQGEVIPGLESEFVSIRESTASMSKTRGSSLIEYAQEFCARNDIYTETA